MFATKFKKGVLALTLVAMNTAAMGGLRPSDSHSAIAPISSASTANTSASPAAPAAEHVEGAGWLTGGICAGCILGGVLVVYTGLPAWAATLAVPTVTQGVLLGCIAACTAAAT